jgi:hypothetical protein
VNAVRTPLLAADGWELTAFAALGTAAVAVAVECPAV